MNKLSISEKPQAIPATKLKINMNPVPCLVHFSFLMAQETEDF